MYSIRKYGSDVLTKEMDQLYRQTFLACFYYILCSKGEEDVSLGCTYTGAKEQKKLKGVMLFNRKTTIKWFSREDTSSPTASLEGFFMETIDVYDGRDIMVLGIDELLVVGNE